MTLEWYFGVRLRELRLWRGLTLKQLGERTGLKTGALSQIERGLAAPRLKTVLAFAGALDVEVTDLVGIYDRAWCERNAWDPQAVARASRDALRAEHAARGKRLGDNHNTRTRRQRAEAAE